MVEGRKLIDVLHCEEGRIFCRAKKVMLAVDGSDASARAATVAFEVCELTGSKLLVIHVVPTPSVDQVAIMSELSREEIMRKYRNNGMSLIEGYEKEAEEYDLEVEGILDEGLPSSRIIRQAKDRDVDLIVMGSLGRGGGQKKTGIGSSTERVIEGSDCPVLVTK
ncbi:MAG: hypothetical protein GF309_08390 [Candidatus Lokiarchaeota archaeon]|nr:hypothetical protein [Candidatus Lokiarchaeota archaeon]